MNPNSEKLHVALVGHVDHGKSTILGKLLVETNSLPDGKLNQVKFYCKNHAKNFEYAYLIDTLEREQSQGITIDVARYFVHSKTRNFLFIDTPGHLDFIKNMMSGSSAADIALLVIDAKEGIQENTLRHIFLLSFLQITQVAVVVNKMDKINYNEDTFYSIQREVTKVLKRNQIVPLIIMPISAIEGDNIVTLSSKMPWYTDPTLWEFLEQYEPKRNFTNENFRLPIQDIYRFSNQNDDRRIISGTITSGSFQQGDHLIFYPSMKKATVKSIESNPWKTKKGYSVGFTLDKELYLQRGEVAVLESSLPPSIGTCFTVKLFWISPKPFHCDESYTLQIHTQKTPCKIKKIIQVTDSSTLENLKKATGEQFDIIECVLEASHPIVADIDQKQALTARFVLVSDYQIVAGGTIRSIIPLSTKKYPIITFSSIPQSYRKRFLHINPKLFYFSDLKKDSTFISDLEELLLKEKKLVYSFTINSENINERILFNILQPLLDLGVICLIQDNFNNYELKNKIKLFFEKTTFISFKKKKIENYSHFFFSSENPKGVIETFFSKQYD